MIYALTVTRNRRVAFKQCIKYMARQTLRPDRWIIVSEDQYIHEEIYPLAIFQQTVTRFPQRNEPDHTVNLNMIRGLLGVSNSVDDMLVIMEDDDWYAPNYIETMTELLRNSDVAGIIPTVYYNFKDKKSRVFTNTHHASMASTVIRCNKVPLLLAVCAEVNAHNDTFADKLFYENAGIVQAFRTFNPPIYVGMKGFRNHAALTAGIQWKLTNIRTLIPESDCAFYENL